MSSGDTLTSANSTEFMLPFNANKASANKYADKVNSYTWVVGNILAA